MYEYTKEENKGSLLHIKQIIIKGFKRNDENAEQYFLVLFV